MSPKQSPSEGRRGTAADMHVDPGLPDQLEDSANELRELGYDDLAKRLERTAERARELIVDA